MNVKFLNNLSMLSLNIIAIYSKIYVKVHTINIINYNLL